MDGEVEINSKVWVMGRGGERGGGQKGDNPTGGHKIDHMVRIEMVDKKFKVWRGIVWVRCEDGWAMKYGALGDEWRREEDGRVKNGAWLMTKEVSTNPFFVVFHH